MNERAEIRETLRQYAIGREFRARQVSPLAPFDGVMYNKSGVASELVIVKNRPSPKDKYPTLKIEKKRIDDIIVYARKHSTRAVLCVNWAGEIVWLNLTEVAADLEDTESLFPEATIKGLRLGSEDRVCYCIDTVLFRPIVIQPYQEQHA